MKLAFGGRCDLSLDSEFIFLFLLLAVKVGDDYLVNGRWSIALKKDIKAAGTLIKYRLGKGPGSTEVITAAGPTTKEIQIVVSNNCIKAH